MRVAAAVLMAVLTVACQDPEVPKYQLNPGGPTVQIPTTLKLTGLSGTGATDHQAVITASLRDQDNRGIPDVMLTFTTSKGTIEPATAKTGLNGDVRTTVTNGNDVRVTVSGGGLTNGLDVLLSASLSVGLSIGRAEKNIPTKLEANIAGDATAPLRFVWNFGDGQTAQTAVGTVMHTWAEDGPVNVQVSVTDSIDRSGVGFASVVVRDNPEPPPTPDPPVPAINVTVSASPNPVVVGQPTTLTATATSVNDAPPATTYKFDCTGDGTFEASGASNVFACTYAAAGTQTPKVTAIGGNVSGTGSLPVTILADAPLLMNVVITSVAPLLNMPVTFQATVTSTGPVPISMNWYFDWDNNGTDDEVFTGLGSPQTRTHTFNATGDKTVKMRAGHPSTSREAVGLATLKIP